MHRPADVGAGAAAAPRFLRGFGFIFDNLGQSGGRHGRRSSPFPKQLRPVLDPLLPRLWGVIGLRRFSLLGNCRSRRLSDRCGPP